MYFHPTGAIIGIVIGVIALIVLAILIGVGATLCAKKYAKKEKPGWYVGWYWSSPMGRGAWAENTWASGSNAGLARNWLSQVVTGLDVRVVLPE